MKRRDAEWGPCCAVQHTIIFFLQEHQGLAAVSLRLTLVAMATVMQLASAEHLPGRKAIGTQITSWHISEAKHVYLPIRRWCFCWLLLPSLSRVCPELPLHFLIPALVSQLGYLEGSSAISGWSGTQGKPYPLILTHQISASCTMFTTIQLEVYFL